MRILYMNPNATASMTEAIVAAARAAAPEGVEILGWTNRDGPPSIQGPGDAALALPGLMAGCPAPGAVDAIVIACFDDMGLAELRAAAPCPVLGIGQSAYVMAGLLGQRFSVVTSLAVSVPVIEGNIRGSGQQGRCASVRASGLPVLTIEAGAEATRARLAAEMLRARDEDSAGAVVLGCAGMAALGPDLARRTGMRVIDGVRASVGLAVAAAACAA